MSLATVGSDKRALLERLGADGGDAEARQPDDLARVVGDHLDPVDAEAAQHLSPEAELAEAGLGRLERRRRLDRAGGEQRVARPAAAEHVEEHPAAGAIDLLEARAHAA